MTTLPSGYPVELETTLALDDGRTVWVRPVLPDDTAALTDAIAHADPETLRLRFLSPHPHLSDDAIRRLVEVDYRSRLALVAFDEAGRGVAIGRYEGKPGEDVAEVAIVVAPGWRRVGLATRLLRLVGEAAVNRGIRRLTALYLAENRDVTRLISASGLPHRTDISAGIATVTIDLARATDGPSRPSERGDDVGRDRGGLVD